MQSERLAAIRARFQRFARVEARDFDSPMYAELAEDIAADVELLELAAYSMPEQPPPNMLFAAVQYLLLSGLEHPLAGHYPVIVGSESLPGPAFPRFRDFCLGHRDRIVELVATRRTQTNVVRRCTCLLPAFALVRGESSLPLALIDMGASAGLNLNFDRYAYSYRRDGNEILRWGPPRARIRLEAELRGSAGLPRLPAAIPVASRDGIDIDPVDPANADRMLWLRALIWPEHVERHQQLMDAAAELEASPIRMHAGDAAELLPDLVESVPREHALVVYSTIAFYQFPRESRSRIADTIAAASAARAVWQIAMEGWSPQLSVTRYREGTRETEMLADVSAHGWWIDWRLEQAQPDQ